MTAAAVDKITYRDLYERWERGHWRATEIDFSADREHWHDTFSELERKAALWNYAMFFHGEDAVTDDLTPFIDAAPREEQKYFLATQQVDEARHAVFFSRFMHEVVERGDGTVAAGLAATEPELTWGFRETFAMLDRVTDELRRDHSRPALARAVTMYHLIVEATLAQPGQHFIEDYLTRREVLPGFRAGMRNVALDEQRHIGFGVKLLRDLAAEDSEVPDAVADLLREAFPVSVAVFVPPGWDRRYTEVFGFTLEEIFAEGARSFEAKLRAAGLALESLPGPQILPPELPRRGARAARHRDAPGRLSGREGRPARARPGGDGAAVRQRAPRRGPAHRAARARSCSSGTSRTPSPGTCGSTTATPPWRPGRAEDADVELRCSLRGLGRRGGRAAGSQARGGAAPPAAQGLAPGAVARPGGLRRLDGRRTRLS